MNCWEDVYETRRFVGKNPAIEQYLCKSCAKKRGGYWV